VPCKAGSLKAPNAPCPALQTSSTAGGGLYPGPAANAGIAALAKITAPADALTKKTCQL